MENLLIRVIEKLFIIYFIGYFLIDLILFFIFLFTFYSDKKKYEVGIELKEFFRKVSVIVPAYNEEVSIAQCIDMLSRLDYPDYEIIFCVASPNDPVIPLIRRLIGEYSAARAQLLTGDDLVARRAIRHRRPHDQRLDQALLADRRGQFLVFLFAETAARIERARPDLVEANDPLLAVHRPRRMGLDRHMRRGGLDGNLLIPHQRGQSAAVRSAVLEQTLNQGAPERWRRVVALQIDEPRASREHEVRALLDFSSEGNPLTCGSSGESMLMRRSSSALHGASLKAGGGVSRKSVRPSHIMHLKYGPRSVTQVGRA